MRRDEHEIMGHYSVAQRDRHKRRKKSQGEDEGALRAARAEEGEGEQGNHQQSVGTIKRKEPDPEARCEEGSW